MVSLQVDECFANLMLGNLSETSTVLPRSCSAPPMLGLVEENLSPKSWTYEDPEVPQGMAIAAPPNRAMHDRHVRKVNAFLREVEKKPEKLQIAIGIKREVDEILDCMADEQLLA